MKKAILVLMFISFTTGLFAGGFQINEQGARAMAMGGAFTGLANDPSAIYFNPAGIVHLKGTNFYAGTTLIIPSASFTGPALSTNQYEMTTQTFTPINFYYTQDFTEDLYFGLSVNNPYGLGTLWNENWVGKYLAVDTELRTFFGTAVLAYKVTDNLSVSAGAVFAYGDVRITRRQAVRVPNPANPSQTIYLGDVLPKMEGDGTGFGFTAGILYKATDALSLGLSYRSEVAFDFEGTLVTTPNFVKLGNLTIPIADQNIAASLTTPQNLTFGLAVMPNQNVTLTADFQYVGWSSYEKLEVKDADKGTVISSVDRKYENTYIVRVGMEYSVTDEFKLRGGLLYDNNPVETEYVEPTLPDSDRFGISIGFGGKLNEKLGIDFAYLLLSFRDREVSKSKFGFNGRYSNMAHLFGINLSYSL